MKTLASELDIFRPVIAYEHVLGRYSLSIFRISFFVIWLACVATIGFSVVYNNGTYAPALLGSALIFFALWLEQMLLFSYHNSFYFRGFNSIIGSGSKNNQGLSYEAAQLLLKNEDDVTGAFMTSELGKEVLARLGLTAQDSNSFLASKRTFISATDIPLQTKRPTTVYDIGTYLYMYDVDYKLFLERAVITSTLYGGALELVIKAYIAHKRTLRFWSRDQLSHYTGIGRELGVGIPFELERFSTQVAAGDQIISATHHTPAQLNIVTKIEQTLARNRAANVLLIGQSMDGAKDVIAAVENRVGRGTGLNALAGLSFRVLDTELLVLNFTTAADLEEELLVIFNQATEAGTHVIVIPHLNNFITRLRDMGINLPELIDAYLTLPALHVIGIETIKGERELRNSHSAFVSRFEEIILEDTNTRDTITILEPIALRQEKRRGVFFTYDALVAVAEMSERYLTNGTMPERAIDVLHALAQHTQKNGMPRITRATVSTYIGDATGIPVGEVAEDEKDRLLNLEHILHERIIGQDEAVSAISRTMRRARVDIERTDKPIGSFLFLGPTGVGKTETAKALAHTFFGDEKNMIRLDMTEYSAEHTLGYLIGDANGTGTLTDKLHEHPYSVMLLDEFEKAAEAVHDLFLQILDEGYFTSTHGTRVNARNTIIIATSNAGSDLIRKTTSIRADVPKLDNDIINHIIETGVFKPELINRFDSTIIFEPLQKSEQGSVAKLLINDLTKRVLKQGYYLSITENLLTTLVDIGYDPYSGGRGIQRVLQDILEEKIAKKIINGEVTVGGQLHLDVLDFSAQELSV